MRSTRSRRTGRRHRGSSGVRTAATAIPVTRTAQIRVTIEVSRPEAVGSWHDASAQNSMRRHSHRRYPGRYGAVLTSVAFSAMSPSLFWVVRRFPNLHGSGLLQGMVPPILYQVTSGALFFSSRKRPQFSFSSRVSIMSEANTNRLRYRRHQHISYKTHIPAQ